MKKIIMLISASTMLTVSMASEAPSLNNIMDAFRSVQAAPGTPPSVPQVATARDTSCAEQVQKTVPYSLLRSLMRTSEQEVAIHHNPDSGELRIDLGPLVANCDDMIDYKLEQRNGYTALVMEIRRPTTDGTKYRVKTRSGTSTPITNQAYPQNLDGFMQCLEANTFSNSTPDANKIIYENKSVTFTGQNQGDRLVFAEHGPHSASLQDDVINESNACYSNSNLGNDSFSMRTREEIAVERENREFQEACRSQDLNTVIQAIERFGQNTSLLRIRNELIETEMQTMVDAIKDSSNLEDDFERGDIQAYQVLANNFRNHILNPKLEEIYRLRAEYQRASREEKTRIKNEIIAKIRELQNYIKSGMLSRDFLLHLINDRKHAPLDNGLWLDLVKSLSEIYFSIKNLKDLAFEDVPRNSRDIRDFNESVDDSVDEFMQAINRQQVQTEIRQINDDVDSEIQTIRREAQSCRDQRCVEQARRDIESLTGGRRRAISETIDRLPEGRENDYLYDSIAMQYQLNQGFTPNQFGMCNEMMMMMGQCNPAMMQMMGGGQMGMSAQFGANSQMMNPMMMQMMGAQAQNPYTGFGSNGGASGAMSPGSFSMMPTAAQGGFGAAGGQQGPMSFSY